jgi:hypothetical protein
LDAAGGRGRYSGRESWGAGRAREVAAGLLINDSVGADGGGPKGSRVARAVVAGGPPKVG